MEDQINNNDNSLLSIEELMDNFNNFKKNCQLKDEDYLITMENFLNSLKKLNHNQLILQNKLNDILKNQINTDNFINNLNNDFIHYKLSSKNSNTLPLNNVQLSKTKKYFIDPLKNDLSTIDDIKDTSLNTSNTLNSSSRNRISSKSSNIKRKRGRPPKKRTVDTVIINGSDSNTNNKKFKSEDSMDHDDNDDDSIHFDDTDPDYLDNTHNNNSNIPYNKKKLLSSSSSNTLDDTNDNFDQIINDSKKQKELEKRRNDREKMLVSLKYNDRFKAKLFMEKNKRVLQAMKDEERRKKLTSSNNNNNSSQNDLLNSSSSSQNSNIQTIFPNNNKKLSNNNEDDLQTVINKHFLTFSDHISQTKSSPSPLHNSNNTSNTNNNNNNEDHDEDNNDFTTDQSISDSLNAATEAAAAAVAAVTASNPEMFNNNNTNNSNDTNNNNNTNDANDDTNDNTNDTNNNNKDVSSMIENELSMINNNNNSSNTPSSQQIDIHDNNIIHHPIELICNYGFFYLKDNPNDPISTGYYLQLKFKSKEDQLIHNHHPTLDINQEKMNAHTLKHDIEIETNFAFEILSHTILTDKYVNSLEYFLMEFSWENKLVDLGLKLRESKRTWQRRKALFALFEFWRDQSREKRNFNNFTMLHAVKEMENYRIFINRSVSWFYNHITLLKMILYDLCDNTNTQWREWMFPKDKPLPIIDLNNNITKDNLNEAIDNALTLDFLDDGTVNKELKPSQVLKSKQHQQIQNES